MKPNSKANRRRSVRLKGYDYSLESAYFITICAFEREHIFGEVADGEIRLNDIGRIVEDEWLKTPGIRGNVSLDLYVVMPNHFHGILVINASRGVLQYAPTFRSPSQNVGAIIRGFKSAATKRINQFRRTPSSPVWQRNFYEHIIRNDKSLNKIRDYIFNNPVNWATDVENAEAWDNAAAQKYYKSIYEAS